MSSRQLFNAHQHFNYLLSCKTFNVFLKKIFAFGSRLNFFYFNLFGKAKDFFELSFFNTRKHSQNDQEKN